MAWKNPRWNSITDPDLRAVFLSLEDFLADPTFDKGIQVGNGTQPTYNPATDLKTYQDLLRFGSDEMTAAMAGAPDGSAPASSPAPTVLSALGALVVQWTRVSNADAVTYEVHLSTTSGFTPSGSTKVAENTDGSQAFIRKTAAGAALAYGTTYYVKIVARDADGAASASAQASGTIAQVTGPDIAAHSIVAGSAIIDAAAIDAAQIGSVDAGTITTGFLDVANRINANAIDASKLAALYIQVGKFIRSAGFVSGSSGWAIDGDGTAEFNNVVVRGTLSTNSITGWLTTLTGGGFRTAPSGVRIEMSTTVSASVASLLLWSGNASEYAPGQIIIDNAGSLTIGAATSLSGSQLARISIHGAGTLGDGAINLYACGSGGVGTGIINLHGDVGITGILTNGSSGQPQLAGIPWTAATLLNSWGNLGGGWRSAEYSLDAQSVVRLHGVVTHATSTQTGVIFTLPMGYRPQQTEMFTVWATHGPARIDIDTNGNVSLMEYGSGGSAGYVSLSGIQFTY